VLNMVTKVMRRASVVLLGFFGFARLRLAGIEIGQRLTLLGLPIVSRVPGSSIRIGNRVVLCSDSRMTALGVSHPVILRTLQAGAELIIGDDVGISGGSICCASRIQIGPNSLLGADVVIVDTDFHRIAPQGRRYAGLEGTESKPTIIGENVFIGSGSFILKGVNIGNHSVIGARSVVTSDIPANVIAGGNPCRIIKPLPELQVGSQ